MRSPQLICCVMDTLVKNREKLFSNPLLERLTRSNAYVVACTLMAISVVIYIYGYLNLTQSTTIKISLWCFGFLSFTLAEYLIHRFLFHSGDPLNKNTWQYKIHGIHHSCPVDKKRLALPLPIALVAATIIYFMLFLFMGKLAFLFFPGFLTGYAFYLLVHYIIHTRKAPRNLLKFLWSHHYVHHYKDNQKAYGVTSPIWDWTFGTLPIKKK